MSINKFCIYCRLSKPRSNSSSVCQKCFDERMKIKVEEITNDGFFNRKDTAHS